MNLELVRACLGRLGSVVFGWHYHYAGGSSRSDVVFGSADDLILYLDRSRPGDHFTLYDLDRVAPFAVLHLGAPTGGLVGDLSEHDRGRLAERANDSSWKAVVLVQRALGVDGRVEFCSVKEVEPEHLTVNWDDAKQFGVRVLWPQPGARLTIAQFRGEIFAFDESALDLNEETGKPVDTVSAGNSERSRALVDAKRPDSLGRVPLSGPY